MFSSYLKFFFIPVLGSIALNLGFAVFNDPIDGDLTRIGGYREVDYGWNGTQQEFIASPVNYADSLLDYDKYYDILVIGDSFTFKPRSSWADYFLEKSGLSIIAFPDDKVDLHSVLSSKKYIEHPPKFLIYEVVERNTISRLSGENLLDLEFQNRSESQGIENTAFFTSNIHKPVEKKSYRRRVKWDGLHEFMSQGFYFYSTQIKRYLFDSSNRVVELALRKEDTRTLFSCRKIDRMLFLEDDLKATEFNENDLSATGASLELAQSWVESNGRTKFVALLFPDKLTAYRKYLSDNPWGQRNLIKSVSTRHKLLRLDNKFEELIQTGIIDLYSPNNTHTSSLGDQEVAKELVRYLSSPSLAFASVSH